MVWSITSSKSINLFGIHLKYLIHFRPTKGRVDGVISKTLDGKHVLIIDYDDLPYDIVKQDLVAAQKNYELGNIYILESSEKRYHAVCLDKIDFSKQQEIVAQSLADQAFKMSDVPTLRFTKKEKQQEPIQWKETLYSKKTNELSKGHLMIYLKHVPTFPIGDIKVELLDGIEEPITVTYEA